MHELTKAQRRALGILRGWPEGLSARAFAAAAYPEAFRRTSATGRRGRGTLNGAGASLKAGAFLRRLFRLELVDAAVARDTGLVTYRIAAPGLAALEHGTTFADGIPDPDPAPTVTVTRDAVTEP